jgi:hypothetical protein
MVVCAVLFVIGGVLEITPDLGVVPQWEDRLGVPASGSRPRADSVIWSTC